MIDPQGIAFCGEVNPSQAKHGSSMSLSGASPHFAPRIDFVALGA